MIDPRALPPVALAWPAAYTLRPVRVPSSHALAQYSDLTSDLDNLVALTDPLARADSGVVPLAQNIPHSCSRSVRCGFSHIAPEWRYDRGMKDGLLGTIRSANMWAGQSLPAAYHLMVDRYTQFLRDTAETSTVMNMAVDRLQVKGHFADISDVDTFASLYSAGNDKAMQDTIAACADHGFDGVVMAVGQLDMKQANSPQLGTIILNPIAVGSAVFERNLAFDYDGKQFIKVYDYRDHHWQTII